MKKSILLFLMPLLVFSQQKEILKTEKSFENQHYYEFIKKYESLVTKGIVSADIYQKLADANYLNANYIEANKWYSLLFELNPLMDAEHHFRYAQTLKSVGLNTESQKQLAIFENQKPNEIRTQFQKNEMDLKSMFSFSNIQLLPFNSKYSDYGTAIKGDTLVFASARDFVLDNKKYARTNQSYTSLYQSIKRQSGEFSTPKLFSKGSFSIYNEGTAVFTKDGKTMYYSQNQLSNKSKINLVNGLFKIYKSEFRKGKWINKGPVSFNTNDTIRVAHPALSPDGKYLYFVADFKESFGKSDIFKVAINDDDSFGEIEHLNQKINTEGRETFPFITEDNTLIFASDGHAGYGGLDLFAIDLSNPNAIAVNLGTTINSPFDDFALSINSEMNQGYFSSNRPSGNGDDDIYAFDLSINPISISGTIVDSTTKELIANATITILDANKNSLAIIQSDAKGYFNLNTVKPNSEYTISVKQPNYTSDLSTISVFKNDIYLQIAINKEQKTLAPETDLANLLALNIIYFDTDKSLIRKEAKPELDKVAAIMKQYPQVNIEIGSHTDSRESKKYNLKLSQERANATLKYLVSKGIDASRLTAKGYGESQLVNKCKDNVKCNESEHQKNRRSTFIIKK